VTLDVLAIGELVVDFISHEMAHSLRMAGQFSRYLGGQPANVAVYVAKLGGRSAIITKLGCDYFGEYVEDQLQHHGVNTEAVRYAHEVASLKLKVEGHVERMIDRESLYAGLESAGQRTM
jgi:bifunctional ADP-heptose synthase (sugar kinase/adenylyltransferase)